MKYWTSGPGWLDYVWGEPGLSEEVCKLFMERKVKAVGTDTVAGDTPMKDGKESHSYGHDDYWLPNDILILEMLANLDKLPTRCFFIAVPLKIKGGSGSPIRPFAVV